MGLKDKLIAFGICSAIAVTPIASSILVEKIYGNPHNMKAMSKVQPFIFLYDKNNDGEADTAMECFLILGGTRGGYSREPTQEEKEWYRTN